MQQTYQCGCTENNSQYLKRVKIDVEYKKYNFNLIYIMYIIDDLKKNLLKL